MLGHTWPKNSACSIARTARQLDACICPVSRAYFWEWKNCLLMVGLYNHPAFDVLVGRKVGDM